MWQLLWLFICTVNCILPHSFIQSLVIIDTVTKYLPENNTSADQIIQQIYFDVTDIDVSAALKG